MKRRKPLSKAKDRQSKGPEEVYAHETLFMANYPDVVELQLQVIHIGDLAIAAIPCEVFCEIGLSIEA